MSVEKRSVRAADLHGLEQCGRTTDVYVRKSGITIALWYSCVKLVRRQVVAYVPGSNPDFCTETLALDVCRNARAGGLDLIFVATGGGDLEADLKDSGVEFVHLERHLPLDPRVVASLRKIITKSRLLHAQSP